MRAPTKSFCVLIMPMLLAGSCNRKPAPPISNAVIPTENQLQYQKMEMIGFIHFSINTFTNKEWGYGDEDPILFNPTDLDVEQWVLVAKKGGLGQLILTAKHHDGFCLWPSAFSEHSVKKSLEANNPPAISELGIYKASPDEYFTNNFLA